MSLGSLWFQEKVPLQDADLWVNYVIAVSCIIALNNICAENKIVVQKFVSS